MMKLWIYENHVREVRSAVPVNELTISVTALDGMDTAWL